MREQVSLNEFSLYSRRGREGELQEVTEIQARLEGRVCRLEAQVKALLLRQEVGRRKGC
jgi:hypothetical protein